MNKDRRKAIAALVAEAQVLAGKLEDLASEIEAIKDEEQEYFDKMPESLQGGDKGQAAEAAVASLEEALDQANSAKEAADLIESNLEDAANG